jgi:hypothetical protein
MRLPACYPAGRNPANAYRTMTARATSSVHGMDEQWQIAVVRNVSKLLHLFLSTMDVELFTSLG